MEVQKELVLDMFKAANPLLLEMSQTISVDEITESFSSENSEIIVHDPPLLQITVKHPFIFDNRLVPSEFKGIKVLNVTTGKFPAEFPEPLTDGVTLEEYFAPQRYIQFVERKLSVIRKELKKSNLTKEEAVDALIGS